MTAGTAIIRQLSYGYPTSTLDASGRPVGWAPDSVVTGEAGNFRIEIGATWDASGTANPTRTVAGVDMTTYQGAATVIDSLSFGEPYGELTGQLTIPGMSVFNDLTSIYAGSNVDIYRTLGTAEAATAGTAEVPYWHGFIASIEYADAPGLSAGISVQLFGALFGEATYRAHQPIFLEDNTRDIGTSLGQCLFPQDYSRPFNPYRFYYETATTGFTSGHRGSRGQMVIDFADEMLALAQDTNWQWTISRAFSVTDYPIARKYYLRQKSYEYDTAIQQNTAFVGGYGVAVSFTSDLGEAENAIYGEGLAPDGSRWRNAKYPQLFPNAPAYPDRISGSDYPIQIGDTDADFTADIVTQLQYALRSGGWPDVEITGTFDTDTETALYALQEDAGAFPAIPGTIADNAGWDLVWSTGTGTTDISSGYFRPLSVVAASEYYEFAPNGAVIGTAVAYDGRLRVERVIAYGDGISKGRARINARRYARQNLSLAPIWSGTITLTGADPAERSRLLVREGSYVRVNGIASSYKDFYVAGVTVSDEGNTVTLAVSESPYDLLDLTTRLERNREAKVDPAKSFYALRNRPQRPMRDAVGWDKEAGAGLIQPTAMTANTWNVVKFIGAQRGSIGAISATTSGTACAYAFAMFGGSVSAASLNSLVPTPLGTVAGGYDSHWAVPANGSALTAMSFIEAWGSYGEAAGYWPGAQSIGTALAAGTVTGRMVDSLAWDFVSTDPPFLWAAVWPTSNCTFKATARILIEE